MTIKFLIIKLIMWIMGYNTKDLILKVVEKYKDIITNYDIADNKLPMRVKTSNETVDCVLSYDNDNNHFRIISNSGVEIPFDSVNWVKFKSYVQ